MRYVIKFGGSSLESATKIKKVAKYIAYFLKNKADELVVVVSAMGKTTDTLFEFAQKINKNASDKKLAELVCLGERISAGALSLALEKHNVQSVILPADKIKIHAKGSFTNGIITHIDTNNILQHLEQKKVVIVPGFQGINNDELCMLGRGGSDTTAVALGAVLDAQVIIYTDVKGFYSENPNAIKTAKQLDTLNIKNAIELASCGAKIMEQKSLEIADSNNVKLSVCKSCTKQGTTISQAVSNSAIQAISHKENLYLCETKNAKTTENQLKTNGKSLFEIILKDKHICIFENLDSTPHKSQHTSKLNKCEMITIVGAGIAENTKFKTYLHKTIEKMKIFTFYISFSPTTVKIITKQGQAFLLAKRIHNKFCLNKNNVCLENQ